MLQVQKKKKTNHCELSDQHEIQIEIFFLLTALYVRTLGNCLLNLSKNLPQKYTKTKQKKFVDCFTGPIKSFNEFARLISEVLET